MCVQCSLCTVPTLHELLAGQLLDRSVTENRTHVCTLYIRSLWVNFLAGLSPAKSLTT